MEAAAAGADSEPTSSDNSQGEVTVARALTAFGERSALRSRSSTLDGSVPLRAAQGCAPLLEGNAFGRHVVLSGDESGAPAVLVERGALSTRVTVSEPFARAHRAVLPVLEARGVLGEAHRAFFARYAKSPAVFERGVLRVFTGLLLAPSPGVALQVGSNANRRPRGFTVETAWVTDAKALTPLELVVRPQWEDCAPKGRFALRGEVATLGAFRAGARIEVCPLEEDLAAAHAHTGFYSPEYFQSKRDGVTRSYRKVLTSEVLDAPETEGPTRVIEAGPNPMQLVRGEGLVPDAVRFGALLAFDASYDGHTVSLEYDKAQLASHARALETRWGRALGEPYLHEHRRALWYLTKYFTPHTPGEPHFFVKPWAFVRTPAGHSSLLEGLHGAGYDVLRGVVHTDAFHAAPAVFALHGGASVVRVREGAPLLEAIPVPRALVKGAWSVKGFDPDAG